MRGSVSRSQLSRAGGREGGDGREATRKEENEHAESNAWPTGVPIGCSADPSVNPRQSLQ